MKVNKPGLFELLAQSLRDVEGGYDMLAPKFDHSPFITPERILVPFFDELFKREKTIADGLDLCCGSGAASKFLIKLCSNSFTGFDLSQSMLERCKERIYNSDATVQTRFVKGNVLDMPFKNEFDLAVSFGAFGHILQEEEDIFIHQIHKALRPGGKFYFVTTGPLPVWSISYLKQRTFNALMKLRNWVIRPKFIMYYLTFRLPLIQQKLESLGFEVEVYDDIFIKDLSPEFHYYIPLKYFKMVRAVKRNG